MRSPVARASPPINTQLQLGVEDCEEVVNRFNGLHQHVETVETVSLPTPAPTTPLKWGVNESGVVRAIPTIFKRVVAAILLMLAFLLSGCAMGVEKLRLVSGPNMQFTEVRTLTEPGRIASQLEPGRMTTAGAQASVCTSCR